MQSNYNKEYEEQAGMVPAGFFVRLAAYIIDGIIVGIVLGGIRLPFWVASFVFPNAFWRQDILFTFSWIDLFTYAIIALYFIILTYVTGATLGKKLLNIQVISGVGEKLTSTQVVYRETVGRYLTTVLTCIGYLLIPIDKEKRALHDVLADTKVVYAPKIKAKKIHDNHEREMQSTAPAFVEPQLSGGTQEAEYEKVVDNIEL